MAKGIALLYVSDEHINSKVGLCKPSVQLDEGDSWHASRTQSWLWRCWKDFIAQATTDTQGYERVLVNGGDLGELDAKRRTNQIISPNKATIQRIVLETMEPMLAAVDRTLILRGTPAHEGKGAWLEEWFGNDIKAIQDPNKLYSWWQWVGKVEEVTCDFAHHAPSPGRRYRRGSNAVVLAGNTVWDYLVNKNADPPALVMRSHNHQRADSGNNHRTHVLYTRAWTTPTEYAYRMGYENERADIGGAVVFCEGDQWRIKEYPFERPEMKRVWAMRM